MDAEIGGDLLDRHPPVIAVASHPHDIVTELSGIRPGHRNILPAHTGGASQLRSHLFLQQTRIRACILVLDTSCDARGAITGEEAERLGRHASLQRDS